MFRTCGHTQERTEFHNVSCSRAPPYIVKTPPNRRISENTLSQAKHLSINKNCGHPYPISPYDDKHAIEYPL